MVYTFERDVPYLPVCRSHRCISRMSKIRMLDKTFKSTGV